MSKKPKPQSLFHRTVELFKRNPFTSVAAIVTIFVGIPGAVAGYNYGAALLEPAYPALHYWVKDWTDDRLKPLTTLAQSHSVDLDYLILKDQRAALKDAKEELAKNPASTTAPQVIEHLQRSIETRQKRLDEATRK